MGCRRSRYRYGRGKAGSPTRVLELIKSRWVSAYEFILGQVMSNVPVENTSSSGGISTFSASWRERERERDQVKQKGKRRGLCEKGEREGRMGGRARDDREGTSYATSSFKRLI